METEYDSAANCGGPRPRLSRMVSFGEYLLRLCERSLCGQSHLPL
jgi:hypothetical protein